jgi:hypothetical protein
MSGGTQTTHDTSLVPTNHVSCSTHTNLARLVLHKHNCANMFCADTQHAERDKGTQEGEHGASGPGAMPEAAKGKWCGGAKGEAGARMRGTDGLVRGTGM